VGVDGKADRDFVRRFRKGAGADPSASGATRVAGVDGCRGGWVVVLAEYDGAGEEPVSTTVRLCTSFAEVLALVAAG
jgi:hypothetical protein